MAGTIDQQIAIGAVDDAQALPVLGRLHEWVVTVDHKRLGLMYIAGGLVFLVVAGLQALTIRLQLAIPDAGIVPPQMFNRLLTMHGTAMVFLVGMPILTGFFNYLVPLMIGARDLAFPRLNAFGFWLWFFGAILLYFSYIGGDGLYGAGSAPDVGWFAYAPLTELPFSRGNSTDYWILSIFLTSVGSTATAINIIATAFCMRCEGMTLTKMPVLAWLAVVVAFHDAGCAAAALGRAGDAATRPLPRRALLRHSSRRIGDTVAALLLDLRPSRSLYPGHSRLRVCLRDHSGLRAQGDFRLQRDGGGVVRDRVHQPERVGASYVRGRHDAGRQLLFRRLHDAGRRADRHQDFQLARHNLGRQNFASGCRCCSAWHSSFSF